MMMLLIADISKKQFIYKTYKLNRYFLSEELEYRKT